MKIVVFILLLVAGFVYHIQAQDDSQWCAYCHSTKLQKKHKHGAISEKCTFCHVPHNATTENPSRLSNKINDLCLSCHDDASLEHPAEGHPHHAEKDPVHPEKEFSCASCHNPHSSDMTKLFRYNYKEGESSYRGVLCAVCHWGDSFEGPPPSPPLWE